MSAMPGNNWGEIFYNLLVIYLFLSLVLTCYSVIRMYIVKHFCNGVKYGKARIKQLTAQGRFRQLPVYSLDEIYEDKDLGTVRLSVFPNDSGEICADLTGRWLRTLCDTRRRLSDRGKV